MILGYGINYRANHNKVNDLLLTRFMVLLGGGNKKRFIYLLGLMLSSSLLEIISIGAIFPFLAVLLDPDKVFHQAALQIFIKIFAIESPNHLVKILTIGFGLAAIIAGIFRLFLAWYVNRVTFIMGANIGEEIYRRALYQPYLMHTQRNSSDVLGLVINKVNNIIYSVILPILTIISSSILLIAILSMLILINPKITFLALLIFGSVYSIIIKCTRTKLEADGEIIAAKSTKVIKILQEGLGGFREILLDRSQEKYCEIFTAEDLSLRKAQASNLYISQSPRYIVEALGITLVACAAYFFSSDKEGVVVAIPLLGAFALSAQRLLPILQQLFSSWTNIQASKTSLNDILSALNKPLLPEIAGQKKIVFEKLIQLKGVWFRYGKNQPWILKGVDFSISKGSRIGVVGQTGGGKSTLIDVLMGLLPPEKGCLLVDDQLIDSGNVVSWQSLIAHVPQSIYLADRSIAENIAFDAPGGKIDMDRVRFCAHQAQIAGVIEGWPNGYDTQVGERGVRLSGGQRQRIGIARALYKNAKIIMLDEATSALDGDTEDSVMQVIENLSDDLTVVIVAHRLSTLKKCSAIIKIEDGIALHTLNK